jgi:hypothetical protein
LPAWQPGKPLEPLFGVRNRKLGDNSNEVDAVKPNPATPKGFEPGGETANGIRTGGDLTSVVREPSLV